MPRSGAGVYTPTAGIPVVSGTTISSTAFNNVIDDLGDEITASLPVSGVAPMTGVLRVTLGSVSAPGLAFVGDTDTGIYSTGANTLSIATAATNAVTFSATQTSAWAGKAVGKSWDVDAITDVASAATCDIGAAATSEVNITGTTTITSFGTSNAGIVRRGTFAGVLTLTHNATSLILPGGANITTAAGDSFVARSLGSGNWRVLSYQRASGSTVAPSAAKAWCAFDGTAAGPSITSDSSYNVASITKNGTGDYTITFTTAMADANYCVIAMGDVTTGATLNAPAPVNLHTRATGSVRILTASSAGSALDLAYISVVVFGN